MTATPGSVTVPFRGDFSQLQRGLTTALAPSAMRGIGLKAGAAIGGAIFAAAGIKKGFSAWADFNAEMTKSTAIMGDISGPMRKRMEKAARDVGKNTEFGASQAAEAYFFLASAGLDAQQSVASMADVAKFAQAGQFDLATATDLATDAQSALGLKARGTQKHLRNLARVQDVLVKANTLANATVEQFSESLTNKGGAALRAANKEVEEGVAVLAAYADQGTKGSLAGNALNIVLRDLQRVGRANKEEFKELGIEVFDAQGNMNNMADIIGDLENVLGDMSVEQRRATFEMLGFQDRSLQFMIQLIGTSDAIREYEDGLRDAGGITEEVADKQMEGLRGATIKLKSQFEELLLSVGEAVAPAVESVADAMSDLIEILNDPDLTAAEKFDALSEEIFRILNEVLRRAPGIAWEIGKRIASGVFDAFREANPLGKLLIGAGLIRLIGGRGKIMASGAAVGRLLGFGMASGAAQGLGGVAGARAVTTAGKTVGVTAGGAAGLSMGDQFGRAVSQTLPGHKVVSAFKKIRWARIGMAGVGIGLATALFDNFEVAAKRQSEDVMERIAVNMAQQDFLTDFGDQAQFQEFERLVGQLERVAEIGGTISPQKAREFQEALADMDLPPQLHADLSRLFQAVDGPQAANMQKALDRIQGRFQGAFNLERIQKAVAANMRDIESNVEAGGGRINKATWENFDAARDAIETAFERGLITTDEKTAAIQQVLDDLNLDPATSQFASLNRSARQHLAGTEESVESLGKKLDGVVPTFRGVNREARQAFAGVDDSADKSRQNTSRATGRLADNSIENILGMVDVVGGGMRTLRNNTNRALKALNVGTVEWQIENAKRSGGFKPQFRRRGGPIDVGAPSGDSVPAVLEKGEYVLNRKAVRKVGKEKLDQINFGMAPRFQLGGAIGLQRGGLGDVAGLQPGIMRLVRWAGRRYGLLVSSGLRPWSAGSHHQTGHAADFITPGAPMPNPQGMRAAMGIDAAWRRSLEELIYTPLGFSVKGGQKVPPYAQADHFDHIHAAILGMGVPGPAADQIARLLLRGPDGPLKDMGQKVLDRVRRGSNRHIDQHSMIGHGHAGDIGGTLTPAEFLRIAGRAIQLTGRTDFSAQGLLQLAMKESGLNAGAINTWDINARMGIPSQGLMQIIPPNFSTYHQPGTPRNIMDPLANIAAAINYMVSRYGGQVTHSPYREGGMVGMQEGGLVGGFNEVVELIKGAGAGDLDRNRAEKLLGKGKYAKLINSLLGAGKGQLRKMLGRISSPRTHLPKLLDIDLPDSGGIMSDANRSGELAGRAGQLTKDLQVSDLADPSIRRMFERQWGKGEVERIVEDFAPDDRISLFGRVGSKDELGWLHEHLRNLLGARNAAIQRIVGIKMQMDAFKQRVHELIDRIKDQLSDRIKVSRELVQEAVERRRQIRRRVDNLAGQRQRLRRWQENISKIRPRNRNKIQRQRLAEARERLPEINRQLAFFRPRLEALAGGGDIMRGLRERVDTLSDHRSDLASPRPLSAIAQDSPGRIWGYLDSNLDTFQGGKDEAKRILEGIQGQVIGGDGMRILTRLPQVGRLGGDILETQLRLDRLGEDMRPPVRPDGATDPRLDEINRLLQDQLAESRRAFAVSQVELGAFGPFMGEFAKGGVALVGERGPELAHMPSGTRVHSAQDTERLLKPEVIINGDIVQKPGDRRPPVELRMGDRRTEDYIVSVANRGGGRRVTRPVGSR